MLDFTAFSNIQLDIVGFLAILGEASVESNAQVTALSAFSYVPRLVPAPQALIRHDRQERLRPLETARVVSSHSGNSRDQLNHIASIVHDLGKEMEDYTVRVIEIKRSQGSTTIARAMSTILPKGKLLEKDKSDEPEVKAHLYGPLTGLSILGAAMSLTLLVVSIVKEDGMSLLATITLSTVSSIIGIGSRWKLELPKRRANRAVPTSDVIIKLPQGAFIVVKCPENIQRELYWHPEKCNYYVPLSLYRFISLVATLLLMFGVIFLANATETLQIIWAGAYVILNAAYWIVAALPEKVHWDTSSYERKELTVIGGSQSHTFTHALWNVIAITRSAGWAKDFDIAPKSTAWDQWLREAEAQLAPENTKNKKIQPGEIAIPEWDPTTRLSELLADEKENGTVSKAV